MKLLDKLKEDFHKHRKVITRFITMRNYPDVRFELLDATQNNNIINIVQKWEENRVQMDVFI